MLMDDPFFLSFISQSLSIIITSTCERSSKLRSIVDRHYRKLMESKLSEEKEFANIQNGFINRYLTLKVIHNVVEIGQD